MEQLDIMIIGSSLYYYIRFFKTTFFSIFCDTTTVAEEARSDVDICPRSADLRNIHKLPFSSCVEVFVCVANGFFNQNYTFDNDQITVVNVY